jgi:hypothetical protein
MMGLEPTTFCMASVRATSEAGIGKTALLEYVSERAEGCRVARAVGVQSEMELPFAGLHQLCAPLLCYVLGVRVKPRTEPTAVVSNSYSD